jgi:membrane-associated phospholipid phosphatase
MSETALAERWEREPALSATAARRWSSYARVTALGWVTILAFLAGIGLLLTGPLADSALVRWDERLPVQWERGRDAASSAWSHSGSTIGDTLTVIGIAVALGIVLLVLKRWASVLLLATAMLAEVSIFVATTLLVERDRPDVAQMDVSPPTSSFPSGHTAAATALALSLAFIVAWNVRNTAVKVTVWSLALLIGPAVAVARVYRGMHHPTDVAMGLLMGAACVLLAWLAVSAWASEPETRPTEENA